MLTQFMFPQLITAAMETSLNALLFRDRSMQSARQRLVGRVLKIELKELSAPLIFLFHEHQIDVVSQWEGGADCTVSTRLSVLPKLRDRQNLSPLMRSGELIVDGDIQVVQQFVALLDLAEWDPTEWLAPYIGDVAAEGISQVVRKGAGFIKHNLQRQQQYLAEAITEEWRLSPPSLEIAWFNDEVDALARSLDAFTARLDRMETKR